MQATGNLGPPVLKALLDAGFAVTALTRQGSTHNFPSNVTVAPVDYESPDSLAAALKGQDGVVSTLTARGGDAQYRLIEAAAKAGVRRYVPSEFGSNTLNPKARALPAYRDKVAVQEVLEREAARSDGMTYTLVLNGPFLDWGLAVGFIMDVKGKKATLYDGGERVFSATSLATIGRAVAGVFEHPDETRNRAVYVHDTALTQRKLLEVAKKVVGAEGWSEEVVPVDQMLEQAQAEMRKEHPNPMKFVVDMIKVGIWGEGYGCHFEKTDNALLGIKEMDNEELTRLVAGVAK